MSGTRTPASDSPGDSAAARLAAATTYAPRQDALDQARSYFSLLVDIIDQHPSRTFERDEAMWRLEELVDELSRDTPSAPRIQSRWLRLRPVLCTVRPDLPARNLTDLLDLAVGGS